MTTINPQIDAAVPLMKARAAEFDDEFDLVDTSEASDYHDLADRASRNLARAEATAKWHTIYDANSRALIRRDLLDTMNLCALALSVLPKGGS